MGLQSLSMAAIQITSLVSVTCWAYISLPLVMGPSSASWSLPLVVSSSLCWAFLSLPLVMGPSSASLSLPLVVSSLDFVEVLRRSSFKLRSSTGKFPNPKLSIHSCFVHFHSLSNLFWYYFLSLLRAFNRLFKSLPHLIIDKMNFNQSFVL